MAMRVGELARRTGVGASTLRAWERRYRFLEPERSPSGQRLYDENDVQRVAAVVRLVAEGLTLGAAIVRVSSLGAGTLPDGEGEALLYGQILQVADQGIWVSKDGRTRYANRRMAEIMGYSIDELVTIPVLDFFPEEALPEVKQRTSLVRAGERLQFTTELRRADGTMFLAEITTTPLVNVAGRYDGAVALVNDITARNVAETDARLRSTLLDSIGDAVTASNADGKVVYINTAAERLFGWRMEDVLGREGRPLLAAPSAIPDAARIHETLLKGKRFAGPLRMTRRDGTEFDAHVTCTPAIDEHGTIVGLVAVVNDQTERDEHDREMRAHAVRAESLALLGSQALRSVDPVTIVTEVVVTAQRLLRAERAIAFDATDVDELTTRAASPALTTRLVVATGSRSFAGFVALARRPVIVDDTAHDDRFESDVPGEPTPSSAIGAPIFGCSGIVGVLTAEHATPSWFKPGDLHLIQGLANIIGTALTK
jgi:PAS domain S-box-containing protein